MTYPARDRRRRREPTYFTRSDLLYVLTLAAVLPILTASVVGLVWRLL